MNQELKECGCSGNCKQQCDYYMNQEWEKEFDKKYKPLVGYGIPLDMKSFIHSLLSSQKEQLVKEIERMKRRREYSFDNQYFPEARGYNSALYDVLNILKK